MSIENDLAQFVSKKPLTEKARERAAFVLADTISVALAGGREPEIQAGASALAIPDAACAFWIPGQTLSSTPERAAALNATAGTFLELDEGTRPTGHPGIHIVPALIALMESNPDRPGLHLLSALIAGYEVLSRIAQSVTFHPTVHPHGHLGALGVAAAAAAYLTGDANDMGQTLQIAASLPLRTDWRPCFTGDTVRNAFTGTGAVLGLWAYQLHTMGLTAEANALKTLYRPAVAVSFSESALLAPSSAWAIEQGYFKFYAACALTHPAIEAAQTLYEAYPGVGAQIARGVIRVPDRFVRTAPLPRARRLSAKFSTPYAVATMLLHGRCDDSAFSPPFLHDRAVFDLAGRMDIIADADLTESFPHRAGAIVELELTSGQKMAATCEEPLGGPARPLAVNLLLDKAAYLHPGYGRELFSRLANISRAPSVHQWWSDIVHFFRAQDNPPPDG